MRSHKVAPIWLLSRPDAVLPSGHSALNDNVISPRDSVIDIARRAKTMDRRMQNTLRKQLEARKAEIEQDVSYMADEMKSIGIEQDDENGSIGNHFAEDGASVA